MHTSPIGHYSTPLPTLAPPSIPFFSHNNIFLFFFSFNIFELVIPTLTYPLKNLPTNTPPYLSRFYRLHFPYYSHSLVKSLHCDWLFPNFLFFEYLFPHKKPFSNRLPNQSRLSKIIISITPLVLDLRPHPHTPTHPHSPLFSTSAHN